MKKLLLPFTILLVLILGACNSETTDTKASETKDEPTTITYESETGPVEVPADPKRVVVLATYAGNVAALNVNLVGVDSWSKSNPGYDSYLADVEEVSEENLEKIIELDPDLIIGSSTT
ncbi:MAG: ABC transporter substrate-binding protein, partial [Psychrobacillus psychrodurans]